MEELRELAVASARRITAMKRTATWETRIASEILHFSTEREAWQSQRYAELKKEMIRVAKDWDKHPKRKTHLRMVAELQELRNERVTLRARVEELEARVEALIVEGSE